MKWGKNTSISDLEIFVKTYQDFRLVIIQPHFRNHGKTSFSAPGWHIPDNRETIEELDCEFQKHSIYLIYDWENQHFAYYPNIQQLYRYYLNADTVKFCNICLTKHWGNHECFKSETLIVDENRKKRKVFFHRSKDDHYCAYDKIYRTMGGKDLFNRCPIFVCGKFFILYIKFFVDDKNDSKKDLYDLEAMDWPEATDEDFDDGTVKDREVWIYDIESAVTRNGTTYEADEFIKEFGDVDGMETNELGVNIVRLHQSTHRPNFVAWCKLNDETEMHTANNLEDLATFASNHNDGMNIFLAHYASGYDSRLMLKAIRKVQPDQTDISLIMRGSKIIRMAVGKKGPIFQDSILHMGQSLRSLTKDFQVETLKGFFPHLFNNGTNDNYIGPIPDKKYFDHRFSFRHKELSKRCEEGGDRECTREKSCDYHEFLDWYTSWNGREDWNFKQQLESYCIDDVKGLAQVCYKYHRTAMDQFKLSPWGFSTAPSYMHNLYLRDNCSHFYLPYKKNPECQIDLVQKELFSSSWMTLQAEEVYFARLALRGGRTEIRKVYHEAKEGESIKYIDVVSMYPYNQLVHEYPTGTPTIWIYNIDYYPCSTHWRYPIAFPCKCLPQNKIQYKRKKLDVKLIPHQPSETFLKTFFGFICCDVIPPKNLYHPILVHFDEERKKCLASNEPHEKGVYTSIEIQKFIEYGGIVKNVIRIDQYNKTESKWKKLGKELYFKKMCNSGKAPSSQEERERLEVAYGERFGLDLEGRWDQFDKRPALKSVYKIWNNCGWGKHAETIDHPQVFIHAHGVNEQENSNFFERAFKNQITCKGFGVLDEGANYFKYQDNRSLVRPDCSRQYLPAAVFVTAYSRLQLWEELNKIGERVLMHDTDSIIYVSSPGMYDTPTGNILGEWEEEDYSVKGIVEFLGLGPKSYGLKFRDGSKTFKIKGVAAKQATEGYFGYDVMKKLILEEQESALVPQMTFDYKFGGDITTRYFAKAIKFQKEDLKGELGVDYKIRPFGYSLN